MNVGSARARVCFALWVCPLGSERWLPWPNRRGTVPRRCAGDMGRWWGATEGCVSHGHGAGKAKARARMGLGERDGGQAAPWEGGRCCGSDSGCRPGDGGRPWGDDLSDPTQRAGPPGGARCPPPFGAMAEMVNARSGAGISVRVYHAVEVKAKALFVRVTESRTAASTSSSTTSGARHPDLSARVPGRGIPHVTLWRHLRA
jgi:hypothetical protein